MIPFVVLISLKDPVDRRVVSGGSSRSSVFDNNEETIINGNPLPAPQRCGGRKGEKASEARLREGGCAALHIATTSPRAASRVVLLLTYQPGPESDG
jgi:hypothetical protein